MQSSDSSTLPRQLRLLGFLPWPGTALAIAGETRSPRFRRDPFVRDVAIDPGRASAPRVAVPHILPSTLCTASAPTLSQISWLIPTPHTIAVYAYMSFAESSSLCDNVSTHQQYFPQAHRTLDSPASSTIWHSWHESPLLAWRR